MTALLYYQDMLAVQKSCQFKKSEYLYKILAFFLPKIA